MAVAVFFALSGFVVTEACTLFYAGREGDFLLNRILRLAPGYGAALLLSIGVHQALWGAGRLRLWDFPASGAPLSAWRVVDGVSGLVPGLHGALGGGFEFIPFTWSLRAEMAFYGALAVALWAARRWAARRWGAWLLPGLCCLVLGAGFLLLRPARPSLLSCAPMFLLGAAWWLVLRRRSRAHLALLAASVLAFALGFASWRQHGHPVLAAQGALLAPLLLLAGWLASRPVSARWQRGDRVLGDLSYPLYLNHYAVGLLCTGLEAPGAAIYAAGLAASILLAAAMGRLVDGAMRPWRQRVRGVAL